GRPRNRPGLRGSRANWELRAARRVQKVTENRRKTGVETRAKLTVDDTSSAVIMPRSLRERWPSARPRISQANQSRQQFFRRFAVVVGPCSPVELSVCPETGFSEL